MVRPTGSSPQLRFSLPRAAKEGNYRQIGYYFRVKSFSCMGVSTLGQLMSIAGEPARDELGFYADAGYSDHSGLTSLAPNNQSQRLRHPGPLVRPVFVLAKTL